MKILVFAIFLVSLYQSSFAAGAGDIDNHGVAVETESTVILTWVEPTKNADGTSLNDFKEYKLYESDEKNVVPKKETLVKTIPAPAARTELSRKPGTYYWVLLAVDKNNNYSGKSNEVTATIKKPDPMPPGKPKDLKVKVVFSIN